VLFFVLIIVLIFVFFQVLMISEVTNQKSGRR